MGKCLVTKLLGVVNNDSLLKYNEFRIPVFNSSDNEDVNGIKIALNVGDIVKVDKNVLINGILSNTVTCSEGNTLITIKLQNVKNIIISVFSTKKTIGQILSWETAAFDTSKIQGSPKIYSYNTDTNTVLDFSTFDSSIVTQFWCSYSRHIGKPNGFNTNLSDFVMMGSGSLDMSIEDLANCINIGRIWIEYNFNIGGNLDTLARAQVANGRTSGEISLRVANTAVISSVENPSKIIFGSSYENGYSIVGS